MSINHLHAKRFKNTFMNQKLSEFCSELGGEKFITYPNSCMHRRPRHPFITRVGGGDIYLIGRRLENERKGEKKRIREGDSDMATGFR